MKTELTDVSPTRKEIKIEIEPGLIQSTYDRISDEYTKAAKIPGFRPGHAPRSVVRTRYKNEIRTEVLREILPEAVNNAIGEHSLATIGQPNIEFDNNEAIEHLGEHPITVTVGVEVFPEIKLQKYKGLEAVKRTRPVTDEDVENTIENLRNASASLQPVEDRGAELSDIVTINARGKEVNNPEAEEIKVDDVEVEVGGPGVQKEFTDNLLGVRPDEKKTFVTEYPQDFSTESLAGKKMEYEVEVSAVRRKELPDVDDEWAKSLGPEFDSVETLKTKIREDLESRAKAEAEHRLRGELLRTLVQAHEFEVPETLIEQQTNQRLQEVVREMMGQGYDPRDPKMNWEGAREELKAQAKEDVRATMLMEQIAEAENLTVSEEEVEAEIEAIATAARQSKEQVRAALTKNGGERSIALRLRNRKALDLLIANANVTEAEWTETKETAAEAAAE